MPEDLAALDPVGREVQQRGAQRVERAGADVAVDHAEHAERQGQGRRPAMTGLGVGGVGGGAGRVQAGRSEGTFPEP